MHPWGCSFGLHDGWLCEKKWSWPVQNFYDQSQSFNEIKAAVLTCWNSWFINCFHFVAASMYNIARWSLQKTEHFGGASRWTGWWSLELGAVWIKSLYPSFFPLLLWGPCLSPWLFGQGRGCWHSIWCWQPSGCQQSAPNSWGKGCPPSSQQVLVVPPCTHNQFACGARGRSKRVNPTPQGTAHLHWRNCSKTLHSVWNIFSWTEEVWT